MKELNMSREGLPPGYRRITLATKDKIYEEMKAVAYWERLTMREIFEAAMTDYLYNMPERIKRMPE